MSFLENVFNPRDFAKGKSFLGNDEGRFSQETFNKGGYGEITEVDFQRSMP